MMKCGACGSADVEIKHWIKLNGEGGETPDEPVISSGAFEYGDAFCLSCDSETSLVSDD